MQEINAILSNEPKPYEFRCISFLNSLYFSIKRKVVESSKGAYTIISKTQGSINLDTILLKYPIKKLGMANYRAKNYHEALYFLELYFHCKITEKNISHDSEEYKKLMKSFSPIYEVIYSELDEPDGIIGLTSAKHNFAYESSQSQTVLQNEITANKASKSISNLFQCYKVQAKYSSDHANDTKVAEIDNDFFKLSIQLNQPENYLGSSSQESFNV